jgi:hypothetical protein
MERHRIVDAPGAGDPQRDLPGRQGAVGGPEDVQGVTGPMLRPTALVGAPGRYRAEVFGGTMTQAPQAKTIGPRPHRPSASQGGMRSNGNSILVARRG